MDFWSPGDIVGKWGNTKLLTITCGMTGYVAGAFLSGPINAESVAMVTFTSFCVPFGLPRIIVVDANGFFINVIKELFVHL